MRLRIFENDLPTNQMYDLNRPITVIGRDDACDLKLNDAKISRFHCEIILEGGLHVLLDRRSTNGTYVNNERVVHHMLELQDMVRVGTYLLRVEESPESSSEIKWSDDDSSEISFSIPVEVIQKKMRAISDRAEELSETDGYRQRKPAGESAPAAETLDPIESYKDIDSAVELEISRTPEKALHKIKVLYQTVEQINQLSSLEELYNLLCDKVFEIFEDVEYLHLSMTHTNEARGQNYKPIRFLSRQDGNIDAPLQISQSLFKAAQDTRSGILATDAVRDQRFNKSDSISRLQIRSVMCAPLLSGEETLGVLYTDNRTKPNCFTTDDLELFAALVAQFAVALDKLALYSRLQKAYHETVLALINALEAKDQDTMGHTQRVRQYALGIAREMGLAPQRCSRLQTAAMLHDIGKIGISHQILGKSGALSDTEYRQIKNHVELGVHILQPIGYLQDILPIIRGHHERFDGTGYPDGLKGEEIPLEARILAAADALDAMTSQRTYQSPRTKEEAIANCRKNAGTQFDPEVVKAIEKYAGKYDLISKDATFYPRPMVDLEENGSISRPPREQALDNQTLADFDDV